MTTVTVPMTTAFWFSTYNGVYSYFSIVFPVYSIILADHKKLRSV